MTFRPTLWPTVITVPMLAVLLALGFWQLHRLEWKSALIEERSLRGSGPAIPLPSDARIRAPDLLYRPVTVTGRFMHEAEMHLLNRVRGGVPGMNLVTPLQRADGGPTILVDRGWVPLGWTGSPVAGDDQVVVTGIVREPAEPGLFVPDNRPDTNDWYYVDLVAMARSAGVLPFPDYYIYSTGETPAAAQAGARDRPDYPAANEWQAGIRNDHLSYAITWFALAGVLMAIYLAYHIRWGHSRR